MSTKKIESYDRNAAVEDEKIRILSEEDLSRYPEAENVEIPPELLNQEFYDLSTLMKKSQKPFSSTHEYTGGSVSYYQVEIQSPTTPGRSPYVAECNDIIEALGMNFAEGNVFKAIWRMAAARSGKFKKGYDSGLYDAEKIVFFGQRLVEINKK